MEGGDEVGEAALRGVPASQGDSASSSSSAQRVYPQLLKFQGKPDKLSPKARIQGLLGYKPPFDRHDWIVDRCGKQVRYVIDFYSGKPIADKAVSYYLDVRPALD
eukprot:756755-Hanusia_phi.AAC.4